ncbi:AAA family ATPase [Herbaspirillum rhizosphaerae]|uniref:AAA family ATPase n=1 Tax=Herbaspirillum rhizosphaerae TaxID=346179 RepID=A0ABW8Z8W5_9BURK
MEIVGNGDYVVKDLNLINIFMGKNGCGKSTALKAFDTHLRGDARFSQLRYIAPERGGALMFNATVAQNISNQVWLENQSRQNQFNQFKENTLLNYRKLELLALREMEKNVQNSLPAESFQDTVDLINLLLDNVQIRREDNDFKIYKTDGVQLTPQQISSGESELIALAIECLVFSKEATPGKENILFLDEPDAHLHPDLQARFGKFLKTLVEKSNFRIIAATHSTSFLGAFSEQEYKDVSVAFINAGQKIIQMRPISDLYRKVLPVFGAHPLSNIFNESPILLVEGEDDERVWQQAVRTSKGRIKIFPCAVDSINNLNEYEIEIASVVSSIYDNPKAFSLRDRDETDDFINDILPLIRMRLSCRAAENLLLCDDVLARLNTSWEALKVKIEEWIVRNDDHIHIEEMRKFQAGDFLRKDYDLKTIRNDLMGIMGSNKPWEVVVGQCIGMMVNARWETPNSLANYLGEKVVNNLIV